MVVKNIQFLFRIMMNYIWILLPNIFQKNQCMISKLKLASLFFLLLFCQFISMAENFEMTVSLDYLNNDLKKSLIFSGEEGETLFTKQLQRNGYFQDLEIVFPNRTNTKINLTVLSEASFKNVALGSINYRRFLNDKIITYIDLPANFVLMQEPFSRQFFTPFRYIGKSKAQQDHSIEIKGVYKFNDLITRNPRYRIWKKSMKKDSTLRFRFNYLRGNDFAGYLRVNDEANYRHILLSGEKEYPKTLNINNLSFIKNWITIDLPYQTSWSGNISCTNLETGNLMILSDFQTNELDITSAIEFPFPENYLLDDYQIFLTERSTFNNRLDTIHQFLYKFDTLNSSIFFNPNFDFRIDAEQQGFQVEKIGTFDLFSVSLNLFSKRDIGITDIHNYNSNRSKWNIIMRTNSEDQFYRFILPIIPNQALEHVNFPLNFLSDKKIAYGEIRLTTFEMIPEEKDQNTNMTYFGTFQFNSYHRISLFRHEANGN